MYKKVSNLDSFKSFCSLTFLLNVLKCKFFLILSNKKINQSSKPSCKYTIYFFKFLTCLLINFLRTNY